MIDRAAFHELVASAYHHVYDFVQLRSHPLADALVEPDLPAKERGWRLHQYLLRAIEELAPVVGTPTHSREWRRHQLLTLRHIDALDPAQIAERLAVSRRQYYREYAAAFDALVDVLWAAYLARAPAETAPQDDALLQSETARAAQHDRHADLDEVVRGVLSLAHRVLTAQGIVSEVKLPPDLPAVSVGRMLLRHALMSLVGDIAAAAGETPMTLSFRARSGGSEVELTLQLDPPLPASAFNTADWLSPVNQMLHLHRAHAEANTGESLEQVRLRLPAEIEHTVLVVDDNADMLAFYERCLAPNGYQVRAAQTAGIALTLARQTQPFCILLDLMIPDQDGWDILQTLATQGETAHIPIIICSVLKQKELALALGARSFLEKPINEQTLLATLDHLKALN